MPVSDRFLAELHRQAGVATCEQLQTWGMSRSEVRSQISAGRWRELNEHVVVTHNGPLTWRQMLWAVDRSAPGLHAMCGLTAVQLWRVQSFETTAVHVLVPRGGHVLSVDGVDVVVHESRRFTADDVVRGPGPQLTRLPRSTVDAAVWSRDVWTAYRIFVAPVQQRRALATELRDELLTAGHVRHRRRLIPFAHDLCGGAQALSEVEFLRFCRRHQLPKPECQRRMDAAGRWRYLDATFARGDGTFLRVEIDGGIHLSLAVRSRDTIKDNEAALTGRLVLRYASAAIYADDPLAVDQIRRGIEPVSG
jgi:hypothetical protein